MDDSVSDTTAPGAAMSVTGSTVTVTGSPRSRTTLEAGTRVGRYIILQPIGHGATSRVYKAADPELDRQVALKVLYLVSDGARDALPGRASLINEAKALAQLSHPNVVAVYDAGTHDGHIFITMELVSGPVLRDWLRKRRRSRRQIVAKFAAAGRGLAAAHDAGLVHRDFKPTNVMVGDDGRVRVLDFGLARAMADRCEGHPSRLTGTPAYMSPEQFSGQTIGAASDQFNFCAALYEALYRERPFLGERLDDLRDAVLAGSIVESSAPRRVPARLRRVLWRGLSRDPADRFPDMHELVAELQRRPLAIQVARILAPVAVTLAVVALIAAGWLAWRNHQAKEAHAANEAAAAADLEALDARLDRQVADIGGGDLDRAVADISDALRAFVHHPDYRETRAVAHAWLHHARRMAGLTHPDEELDALASAYAYAGADDPDLQTAALLGLARGFERRWRWSSLEAVLDTLDERVRDGDDDPQPLERRQLRLRVQLAQRDLGAALVTWRDLEAIGADVDLPRSVGPVLAALSRGTPLDPAFDRAHVLDLDGGKPEILFIDDSDGSLIAVRAVPGLPRLWQQQLVIDGGPVRLLPTRLWSLALDSDRPMIVGHFMGNAGTYAVLSRPGPDGLTPVYHWAEQSLQSATVAEWSDGRRVALVGTGPYTRQVLRLERSETGTWTHQPVSGRLGRAGSDVWFLGQSELDGAGPPEIVAGFGPWGAYDVRVLRIASDGSASAPAPRASSRSLSRAASWAP